MDMMEVADPDAVHAVRSFIRKQLASELEEELIRTVYPLLGTGSEGLNYNTHFR